MSLERIAIVVFIILVVVIIFGVLYKFLPKRLNKTKFLNDWKNLQQYCKSKNTWPEALVGADKLLDKALQKRKFKGSTMGERLVSAQKLFTNNDDVWRAHNLIKKILSTPNIDAKALRETDVKSALVALRQALRDLGALPPNHTSGVVDSVEAGKNE